MCASRRKPNVVVVVLVVVFVVVVAVVVAAAAMVVMMIDLFVGVAYHYDADALDDLDVNLMGQEVVVVVVLVAYW